MQARANAQRIAPQIVQASLHLQQAIDGLGLDKRLGELIKLRASQMNGCANCLNIHLRDALKLGETEVRIVLLSAWRESTLFSPRERALLQWVESLTEVSDNGAPDAQYDELKAHFDEQELVAITAAIAMINFWNRIAIGYAQVHPSERAAT